MFASTITKNKRNIFIKAGEYLAVQKLWISYAAVFLRPETLDLQVVLHVFV
jgi:hypothetical protein